MFDPLTGRCGTARRKQWSAPLPPLSLSASARRALAVSLTVFFRGELAFTL